MLQSDMHVHRKKDVFNASKLTLNEEGKNGNGKKDTKASTNLQFDHRDTVRRKRNETLYVRAQRENLRVKDPTIGYKR